MHSDWIEWIWRIIAFLLGGGLLKLWDRFHPTTCVRYEVRTNTLPAHSEISEDSFSEIIFWNPSKRIPAKNLSAIIELPAQGAIREGIIKSEEDISSIEVTVTEQDKNIFRINAERLAPGAQISIPFWYRAGQGEVKIKGTTAEAKISKGKSQGTERLIEPSLLLMIIAVSVFMGLLISKIPHFDNRPVDYQIGFQTKKSPKYNRPPLPPKLQLSDPNTIKVDIGDKADQGFMTVNTASDESLRIVFPLSQRITKITLDPPYPDLSVTAFCSNNAGKSEASDVLHMAAAKDKKKEKAQK